MSDTFTYQGLTCTIEADKNRIRWREADAEEFPPENFLDLEPLNAGSYRAVIERSRNELLVLTSFQTYRIVGFLDEDDPFVLTEDPMYVLWADRVREAQP